MRILAISNLYPPYIIGGYEIACRDFCEGLQKLGHQVEILTSQYGITKNGEPINSDIPIWRMMNFDDPTKTQNPFFKKWLGIKSVYFDCKNFWLTLLAIRKFKPDVVYIWNLSFVSVSPVLAALILKQKISFHLEDYWLGAALRFNQSQKQGLIEEFIKKVMMHLVYRKIAESPFIAVSEHIQQYYLNQGMQGQSAVIFNGLARSFFVENPKPETPVLPAGRQNLTPLLYVGRVVEDKGVHLIIKAMELLEEQGFNDLKLDIIGTGEREYIKRLNAMILEGGLSGRVDFLGQKNHEETLALYSLYSIIVVPSIWDEPFGLVTVEAMARGCVPIVSQSGALPEIVKNGKSGLVFKKSDVTDLAEKIKQLLANQSILEQLGANAVADIKDRFDLESRTKEIEKFLLGI